MTGIVVRVAGIMLTVTGIAKPAIVLNSRWTPAAVFPSPATEGSFPMSTEAPQAIWKDSEQSFSLKDSHHQCRHLIK